MRRTVSVLVVTALSWLLLAAPLLATEGSAAESAASEDSSDNGILFALILGVIVGAYLFIDAYAGSRGEAAASDGHGDTGSEH